MATKMINPWIDPVNENWLKNEIEIVKDRANFGHLIPDKAVEWLCKKNQEQHLFNALTKLAPMYPLIAYHGEPSVWLSPPISGSGNEVVVVMGMDRGRVRMVGCNFCGVNLKTSTTKKHLNFWADYDSCSNDLDKYRLISAFVSENFDNASLSQAKHVDDQSFDFRTMHLYIVCIDTGQVHIWSMPCLIWPLVRPSDMSLEIVKEF
jgi:hypothetical protein